MGKISKSTGPKRRGRPAKIGVKNNPTRFDAVNAALKKRSRKGRPFHKMTAIRAAKVKDYVKSHPLKFPSRTPPEAWCQKLISELKQKNWKITVKDVHIWHQHLPHLFAKPREVSPAPSSSSESSSSSDGINDEDLAAPEINDEDDTLVAPVPDADIDDDVEDEVDDCCCSII